MNTNITTSATQMDIINEKLMDAEIPGFYALFTDEEAALAGAFDDDAIGEEAALVGSYDNPDLLDDSARIGK